MTLKQLQQAIKEARKDRDTLRKESTRADSAAMRARQAYCSAVAKVERLRKAILTVERAERILEGEVE